MNRTAVSPWNWSLHLGYNQAEIIEGTQRQLIKNFDVFGMRFGPIQAAPPMTLLGVTRLAISGLMFEIEATAAD